MSTKITPTLVQGSPATGKKFWPRPDVTEKLLDASKNDHILFPGPRRTGKTSILLHLRDSLELPQRVVFINAEKYSTAPELIQGIAEAVLTQKRLKQATDLFLAWAAKIKGVNVGTVGIDFHQAVAEDWAKAADELLEGLIRQSDPVLVMIDEFSVFVNTLSQKSRDDTVKLLRWFREWRQRLVDTQIRFILTGSIGIDTVLRKLKLGDTINDCRSVEMFPPDRSDAHKFLVQRAEENSIPLSEPLIAEILRLIDPHWHYPLQIFLSEIKDWARKEGRPPELEKLELIYRDQMVAKGNENLKHMWDKLSEIFDTGELRFARKLLKHMSRRAKGMSRREMEDVHTQVFQPGGSSPPANLEFVLDVLRHDGYLIQETTKGQRTRFASNLLRDYWARKNS